MKSQPLATRSFPHPTNLRQNDYKDMRTITDELYARIVKHLMRNEEVAIFQELLLSQKTEEDGKEKKGGGEECHTKE